MAELVMLNPHDALPDGRVVTVLQRFDEDDPDRVIVEIALSGEHGQRETTRPLHPDDAKGHALSDSDVEEGEQGPDMRR